ncbi:MAG: YccF domain-containing protein [Myxococcaceae bacterium]
MSFLFNVLWMIFGGGLVIALEYLFGGLLLCLTIIGIPFGLQCFKLAGLALMPFGKDFDELPGAKPVGFVLNVIWIIFAGIWIFLSHLTLGLGLAVTLIGLPFAFQHLKLAMLALAPFGKRVRVVR